MLPAGCMVRNRKKPLPLRIRQGYSPNGQRRETGNHAVIRDGVIVPDSNVNNITHE